MESASLLWSQRRLLRTEDSDVAMLARRSICSALSTALGNAVHQAANNLVFWMYKVLSSPDDLRAAATGEENNEDTSPASPTLPKSNGLLGALRRLFRVATSSNELHDNTVTADFVTSPIVAVLPTSDRAEGYSEEALTVQLDDELLRIEKLFRTTELVVLLMDVSRYEHHDLSVDAIQLLISICLIQKRICGMALTVKAVPSRRRNHFDRLHMVLWNCLHLWKAGWGRRHCGRHRPSAADGDIPATSFYLMGAVTFESGSSAVCVMIRC